MHEAITYFPMYSYKFCWTVHALQVRVTENEYRQRTPAMAAGLTDYVWIVRERATCLAAKRLRDGQCRL